MKLYEQMYVIFQPLIVSSQPNGTIPLLEKVIGIWPDFAMAHNDLGVLYYNIGEKKKAGSHYEAATGYQPDNITFQKNMADFYYVEEDRAEDALKIYARILESTPDDVETLIVAGHISVSLHRFDEAKTFYGRVLEIEPWNLEVQENLKKLQKTNHIQTGQVSAEEMYWDLKQNMDQTKPNEAIQGLEKLIQLWPNYALAHNDLGVLYYNIGKKENALTHYEEAVRHEPENTTFQKNLADFYYVEEGRIEDALKAYVEVLTLYPEDVEALLATGHICESLKKTDDAKIFYGRVLEIEPWNFEARQKMEVSEDVSGDIYAGEMMEIQRPGWEKQL